MKLIDKLKDKYNLILIAILFIGLFIRLFYFLNPETKMSGDESVYAVQSLHILKGERSVFYYNQPYTGATTAYLGAILMSLFGISDVWIKGVVFLFSVVFLISIYHLALEIFGRSREALMVLAISSFTSPFWANWTTRIGTGYPEATALGNLLLLLTLKIIWSKLRAGRQSWFFSLLGFLGGLGYWVQPTIAYYLAPSLVFLLLWKWKFIWSPNFLLFLAGFIVGTLPVIWWNFGNDNLTSRSIFHSPWGVKKSLIDLFTLGIPVLISNRRPWETKDLIPYFSVFIGLIYLSSYFYLIKERISDWLTTFKEIIVKNIHQESFIFRIQKIDLIFLTTISIITIFSLTTPFNQFVIEPRYVSALNSVFPIIVVYFLSKANLIFSKALFLGGGLLIFNNFYALALTPPTHFQNQYDLKPIIDFLRDNQVRYVFGEYEYSYRLAFETNEEIIAVPIDSPPGEARYPKYRVLIESSPKEERAYVLMRERVGDEQKYHKIGKFKIKLLKEHPD